MGRNGVYDTYINVSERVYVHDTLLRLHIQRSKGSCVCVNRQAIYVLLYTKLLSSLGSIL